MISLFRPSEKKKEADKILEEFRQIAENLSIKYALICGTCLGLVRDKAYPRTDIDIDIRIICDKKEQENLFKVLMENNFILGPVFDNYNRHFLKYGLVLDIYYHFRNLGYLRFFNTLSWVEYDGKYYPIPFPVEQYLQQKYINWKERDDWKLEFTEADIQCWKRKEKIIGYAFVVGDLFHIGHLEFFKKCKKHCDYLIVGVYPDELVQTYKENPVFPLEERLALVESCKYVDEVRIVHDIDCTPMLKQLVEEEGIKVKYLFHGDDWKEVKGTKYIESIGGTLIQPPYYKEQSTTKIKEKIKREY